jgi:hypothetical protein
MDIREARALTDLAHGMILAHLTANRGGAGHG